MRTIRSKKWYTPREIANYGLIKNNIDKSDYDFVLDLIKDGKLAAKNYSRGDRSPRWLVCEEEIERYNKTLLEG